MDNDNLQTFLIVIITIILLFCFTILFLLIKKLISKDYSPREFNVFYNSSYKEPERIKKREESQSTIV